MLFLKPYPTHYFPVFFSKFSTLKLAKPASFVSQSNLTPPILLAATYQIQSSNALYPDPCLPWPSQKNPICSHQHKNVIQRIWHYHRAICLLNQYFGSIPDSLFLLMLVSFFASHHVESGVATSEWPKCKQNHGVFQL